MEKNKLTSMISIISEDFMGKKIPFCLIGAFALGFYGLPRHTVDIDFMADEDDWEQILTRMEHFGYNCFQKTGAFAQFDSDFDVFGRVDFMLINTSEGREMLDRSASIKADLIGNIRVVQPSDYIILKLLAITNNQERQLKDEADIAEFFKAYSKLGISDKFERLNINRIQLFAEKFNQVELIKKYTDPLGEK